MNKKDAELIKELMQQLSKRQSHESGIAEPEEKVNHIVKLLHAGILNPNRFQLISDCAYRELKNESDNNPRFVNLEFISINHNEKEILTSEGNKIYVDFVNQNWWRKFKSRAWLEMLIDVLGVLGFFIGIILGIMKIFGKSS
jgi:hypothetical protein